MLAYDGLELHVGDPDVPEELLDRPDQVGQAQVPVRDEALALVELRQVGAVHALVPEHAVDGKVARGGELPAVLLALLAQLVQHPARHGGGVRPQDVLHRLLELPVVPVPEERAKNEV